MKYIDFFATIAKHPALLRSASRHLFLISHMRANTSVLGHIIGSHPEISGYYEQHIGYYSGRSLLRGRALFHKRNPQAPVTPIYFDKILHNYHQINLSVLARSDVQVIFALRAPETAIRSIMALYTRVDPRHEWASAEGAVKYYRERLRYMKWLWSEARGEDGSLYLDAEVLVNNTEDALTALSEHLLLKPRLESNYDTFALTGKQGYGDSSNRIEIGRVTPSRNTYSEYTVPPCLLLKAREAYLDVRSALTTNADSRLVLPAP